MLVGVNTILNDEYVVYVTCVVQYFLSLYEAFDVGVF